MSRFVALQQRFDAMQPRDRLLISLTAGVLLVLGLYVLWIEPASKAAASNAVQIESLTPQVESARAALALVQEELARDPEAERRLALDRLKQESGELDARLRADDKRSMRVARNLHVQVAKARLVASPKRAVELRRRLDLVLKCVVRHRQLGRHGGRARFHFKHH